MTKAWDILEELFPIYRTLMGEGYSRSLSLLARDLPMRVHRFPTGSRCGSWTIGPRWEAREAFVQDSSGRKVVDFKAHPFHLWQYSSPFEGRVSRGELLKHLRWSDRCPGAIPLTVAYYKRDWGFSVGAEVVRSLQEDSYLVRIDASFQDGHLEVGEVLLPGKSRREILIDSVLSCASLANNLSGPAAAAELAGRVASLKDRLFTYRFLFTPETIGPIALHFLLPGFGRGVEGGWTLVNLADAAPFHYKLSRPGGTAADKAMLHALRHSGKPFSVRDFDVRTGTCGNEKSYNSLGIEIPIGAFHRSPLGSYPEYDTSKDDLSRASRDALDESVSVVWRAVEALERSVRCSHLFEGEPFLTGYGLFPNIREDRDRLPYDYLMGFSDGRNTLVDIAEKAGLPVAEFDEPLRLMREKGLVRTEPIE